MDEQYVGMVRPQLPQALFEAAGGIGEPVVPRLQGLARGGAYGGSRVGNTACDPPDCRSDPTQSPCCAGCADAEFRCDGDVIPFAGSESAEDCFGVPITIGTCNVEMSNTIVEGELHRLERRDAADPAHDGRASKSEP